MKKVTEQQLMSASSLLREYIAVVEADDLITVDGESRPRSEVQAQRDKLQKNISTLPPHGVAELSRLNAALGGGKTPAAAPAPKPTAVAPPPQPNITPMAPDDYTTKLGASATSSPVPKTDPTVPEYFPPTPKTDPTVPEYNPAAAKTTPTGGSGKPAVKAPAAPIAHAPAKPDPTVMFQQQELNKMGAGLKVDGIKGKSTIDALKKYKAGQLAPYVDPGSAQGQALRQQTAAPKPAATAPRPAAPRTNSVDASLGAFGSQNESVYSDVPTLARITQLAGL